MLTVKITGNWRIYWGAMPLPGGAEAIGIVTRDTDTGALIRLVNNTYVKGNVGSIRTLNQQEVENALKVSYAASMLGSIRSDRKAKSSAANGKLGGRDIPGHWPDDRHAGGRSLGADAAGAAGQITI